MFIFSRQARKEFSIWLTLNYFFTHSSNLLKFSQIFMFSLISIIFPIKLKIIERMQRDFQKQANKQTKSMINNINNEMIEFPSVLWHSFWIFSELRRQQCFEMIPEYLTIFQQIARVHQLNSTNLNCEFKSSIEFD